VSERVVSSIDKVLKAHQSNIKQIITQLGVKAFLGSHSYTLTFALKKNLLEIEFSLYNSHVCSFKSFDILQVQVTSAKRQYIKIDES